MLTDMWTNKYIIRDIAPRNCLRTANGIIFTDLGSLCPYTDNLFLNQCVRLFIYLHFWGKTPECDFIKLRRSAINNFDLPQLTDAREFVNRAFANIIFSESRQVLHLLESRTPDCNESYDCMSMPNLEMLFFERLSQGKYLTDISIDNIHLDADNYFSPKTIQTSYSPLDLSIGRRVSLLIKTCVQDYQTVEANIRHIVRQLSRPDKFLETIVSVDCKKEEFLREYSTGGNYEEFISLLERLKEENVIDRIAVFEKSEAANVNRRWFDLECNGTHTIKNVPVASQLFAFEQCRGEYILQMDCDVMIGRKDYNHSFLSDMIDEKEQHEDVVSVGFNIYNRETKPYFGHENGGFVPEVRLGLFHKERLFNLRPLPNSLSQDGLLNLSWYRSMEQAQKERGVCSIRGGNDASFYVHPQNYRKTQPYAWMLILDRIEQGFLPDNQYARFDCEGGLSEWCRPKRNEDMVVLSVFRNVAPSRFLRFWASLVSQSFQDFGVILYDDSSDNGLQLFIDHVIKPWRKRVTFIKGRCRQAKIANVYQSLHLFIDNQHSIIVMADADDALIGSDVLSDLHNLYVNQEADVVVGRMHQTYRLQANYRYPADFANPRLRGGNVWQHLKSFKKYLFDAIPLSYFKFENIEKKLTGAEWLSTCDDFAIMVPIVEMSKAPLQSDFVNYFYERNYETRNAERDLKEHNIACILNKKPLDSTRVFFGRKRFITNLEMIELDITYRCNLKCHGCNRSCGKAPTDQSMDIGHLEGFVRESIDLQKKWKLINVLGGEPTLHPAFLEIVDILQEYADSFSPNTIIQVVSNGIDKQSLRLLEEAKLRKNVRIDYNSFKSSNKIEYFSPFCDAPIDDPAFKDAEFDKACWGTAYCGLCFNGVGYYACAPAAGIDRVLGQDRSIKKLSEASIENLSKHFNLFCPLCGKKIILKKSKKGRSFYGCEGYPDCTFMTWSTPVEDRCPKCKNTLFKKGGRAGKLICEKPDCGYERPL